MNERNKLIMAVVAVMMIVAVVVVQHMLFGNGAPTLVNRQLLTLLFQPEINN